LQAESESCTVTITHASTRVTWTIRPVLFLPLAHRQVAELPACAYDFKPHAPGFIHEYWFWHRFRAAVTERCEPGGGCLAGQDWI
jgi:hypothetical protein